MFSVNHKNNTNQRLNNKWQKIFDQKRKDENTNNNLKKNTIYTENEGFGNINQPNKPEDDPCALEVNVVQDEKFRHGKRTK